MTSMNKNSKPVPNWLIEVVLGVSFGIFLSLVVYSVMEWRELFHQMDLAEAEYQATLK